MNKKRLSAVVRGSAIVLGSFLFFNPIYAQGSSHLNNVNLAGNDIGFVGDVNDANRCETECNKNGKCKAWTWVRPGALPFLPRPGLKGFCALKGSIPNKTQDNCCISGYAKARGQTDNIIVGRVGTILDTGRSPEVSRQRSCQDYARNAVSHQQRNQGARCGLRGPQWNPNYNDHFNWCMRGENLKYTQVEQRKRQDALARCGAGTPAPRSATLMPIPGPKAPAVTPVPIPGPAIDPGLGGQTPQGQRGVLPLPIPKPLSERQAMALAAPVSRADMVNALLADAATRATIRALPNLRSMNPQSLAHQTLGGSPVSGSVQAAGSGGRIASRGMSPTSGPKSPADFDWNAGLQFSPFTPSPTYFKNGKYVPLAETYIAGAIVSNSNINFMEKQKMAYLASSAVMDVIIMLPKETATYMLAVSLSNGISNTDPGLYKGSTARIKAHVQLSFKQLPLTLTPRSDGRGFVGLIRINADDLVTNSMFNPFNATFEIVLEQENGFVFGGFTLTRL